MRTSLCWLALAAASIAAPGAGCSRDKPAPPQPAPGSAAVAAPAPGGVEVFVNDARVGVIAPALVANWPRLDALVPPEARRLGTWEMVSLQGAGTKPTEVGHPSTAYPDMVPAVYPGAGGAPSFGMFDPVELARKGAPAMHEDKVTAIRIKVSTASGRGQNDDGGGGAAGDPTKLVLTFKSPGGTTTLTGAQIMALPRGTMPGSPDQHGWRLSALLDAAGVKAFKRLVLTDASGANLILEPKDVGEENVPFIKLNKQGALRLRVVHKTGDGWTPNGDLRGLTTVEVQ